jgi:hypothetical protein
VNNLFSKTLNTILASAFVPVILPQRQRSQGRSSTIHPSSTFNCSSRPLVPTPLLWKAVTLLTVTLTAGCGCVGGNMEASTPSERCGLPPTIGKTGAAQFTDTGIGADVRNYRPLDSGGGR